MIEAAVLWVLTVVGAYAIGLWQGEESTRPVSPSMQADYLLKQQRERKDQEVTRG